MERERNSRDGSDTVSLYDLWLIVVKRKWVIILVTCLVFCTVLAYSVLAPDVYKVSNMMILTESLNVLDKGKTDRSKDFINMLEIKSAISPLEELSIGQRAKILGLGESVLTAVKDVKISKIEETNALRIEVDTLDHGAGIRMIDALSHYINTLPFIQKRVAGARRLLERNREELKKIIDDPINIFNLPDNTIVSELLISIYDIRRTYNELSWIIDDLESGEVLSLAGKTFTPDKPYKPKRIVLAFLGLFVGIAIGIFFAFSLEWLAVARREHDMQK